MMDVADKDGTNSLDIIEFLQLMKMKQRELTKEDEIADAFSVFDVVGILIKSKEKSKLYDQNTTGT